MLHACIYGSKTGPFLGTILWYYISTLSNLIMIMIVFSRIYSNIKPKSSKFLLWKLLVYRKCFMSRTLCLTLPSHVSNESFFCSRVKESHWASCVAPLQWFWVKRLSWLRLIGRKIFFFVFFNVLYNWKWWLLKIIFSLTEKLSLIFEKWFAIFKTVNHFIN